MKYKLIIALCFLVFALCPTSQIIFAEEENFEWCRITTDNTMLYKEIPSSNNESICFSLPTTYFAEILDCADEEYYKVNFNNVVGYVKKENVTKVYSTPLMPFPVDITFCVNSSVQAVIRDIPSTNGEYLGVIPTSKEAIYLGTTTGDEAILGLGTEWFYVRFGDDENNLSGFIYAPLTQNLKEIPENTEEVLLTPAAAEESGFILSPELMDSKTILIIICLCVVGFLLLLAIFLPLKKKKPVRKIVTPPKFDDLDF